MAVDFLLKINGVDGESKISGHEGEIDVLAWSWGMSQAGTMHVGGGGGAGKVDVQDISLTKYVDKATPNLVKMCCNGKHFDEVLLTVRKAGGDVVDYLTIKMTDALVTSVNTGGSAGEERLTENVTLNFAKYEMTYTPQEKTGAGGGGITVGWDIEANVEA